MADEHGGGEKHPASDLFFLLILLGGIILFWFASGGPSRVPTGGLFVQSPLASFGTSTGTSTAARQNWLPFWNAPAASTTYVGNTTSFSSTPVLAGYTASTQSGTVYVQSATGARSSDPENEYVTLYANSTNSGPINISGWQLKSTTSGRTVSIGGGVEVPLLSQAASNGTIEIYPGDTVIVTTGRSPIGVSFRENSCSAYLSQFQQFNPPFSQSCPIPSSDLRYRPDLSSDQSCMQAVAQVAPCQVTVRAPSGASAACSAFITQQLTYNGCVTIHKGDQNFKGRVWRVYLGQSSELWNNSGDTVALLDAQGKLVGTTIY